MQRLCGVRELGKDEGLRSSLHNHRSKTGGNGPEDEDIEKTDPLGCVVQMGEVSFLLGENRTCSYQLESFALQCHLTGSDRASCPPRDLASATTYKFGTFHFFSMKAFA